MYVTIIKNQITFFIFVTEFFVPLIVHRCHDHKPSLLVLNKQLYFILCL